jgi:hypothetical protein
MQPTHPAGRAFDFALDGKSQQLFSPVVLAVERQ